MNDLSSSYFLRDFDAASERLEAAIHRACASARPWPARVGAALGAGLELAAAEPAVARLLLIEPWAHGEQAISRRWALLERLGQMLAAGRLERPGGEELPELTEQLLVGACAGTISPRLLGDEATSLPGLAPDLTELVLLPYLGSAEARAWARGSRSPGA
jgi:hypothetical protein